jgi:hypothetical protein
MPDLPRNSLPVADRLAIRELIDRYNDAINHREWTVLTGLFNPDAVWEIATPVQLRFESAPKIAGGIRWLVSRQDVLVQVSSAVVIEASGPDRASVRSTIIEFGRPREGEPGMHSAGTFYDQVCKLDGVWRFAVRMFRVRYTDNLAVPGEVHENRPS